MIFHRRHSLFPLLIVGLTLVLMVLMFYSFTGQKKPVSNVVSEPSPVSSVEYEQSLREISDTFIQTFTAQPDDLARLVLVEQTQQQLLSLRVPADYKDLHLSLVIDLNKMQQALRLRTGETEIVFQNFQNSLNGF